MRINLSETGKWSENFTTDNIEKIIASLKIQMKPMVMITSVYVCLKYVAIPFVNL